MEIDGPESIFDGRSSAVVVLEHDEPSPKSFKSEDVSVVGMLRASYATDDNPLLPLELRLKALGLLEKTLEEREKDTREVKGKTRVEAKNLASAGRLLPFSFVPILIEYLTSYLATPEGIAQVKGCPSSKVGYAYLETRGPDPEGQLSLLQKLYRLWGFATLEDMTLMQDPDLPGKSTAVLRILGKEAGKLVKKVRQWYRAEPVEKAMSTAAATPEEIERLRNETFASCRQMKNVQ
jgi:hypothetical protein